MIFKENSNAAYYIFYYLYTLIKLVVALFFSCILGFCFRREFKSYNLNKEINSN